MNVLIVYAHHEPTSFGAAMLDAARRGLLDAGHTVEVSDLHAMAFDPVSDRRNFRTVADANRLDQQAEESFASRHDGFAMDVRAEIDKLRRADLLVFVFPIWWLSMPAIMKGWVDRVFALGVVYGGGRYFDNGVMKGRRAMCVVSVGGAAKDYDESGRYAPIDTVLYPIHRGILQFTGYEVLPPFVAYGPGRAGVEERQGMLRSLQGRMAAL
jgi:NAD(P)H dehydrogenase (quinone)